MAYVNNGYQRTLMIAHKKYINGLFDSTVFYDGSQTFSFNGNLYYALTIDDLQKCSLDYYNTRLSDWVGYCLANYSITIDPAGARAYNTTACPL